MSRVGMSPVRVPDGVDVAIVNDVLTAKGKLGEESVKITKMIDRCPLVSQSSQHY